MSFSISVKGLLSEHFFSGTYTITEKSLVAALDFDCGYIFLF
jgi:hypothetical protein